MEIHNCIHCGTETQPNWRFCRRCGTALEHLDQQPTIAHCSNCGSPIAQDWRFCFNCGTATDDATAVGGSGLTSDDVAGMIATPPADVMTAPAAAEPDAPGELAAAVGSVAATAAAPAEAKPPNEPPAASGADTVAEPAKPLQPEVLEPEESPAGAEPSMRAQPAITGMDVSFEANPDLDAAPPPEDLAPPRTAEVATEPPAPPFAGSVDAAQIETPPAPPAMKPAEEPVVAAAAEPEESAVAVSQAQETGSTPVDQEPVVHLPPRDSERDVRPEIPTPLGTARNPADTQLPRPLGETATEPPDVAVPRSKPRVAVPKPRPRPRPEARSDEDLPPIDGRSFQNPGLLGQSLQLALTVTAAISVAMMLGLILLNNRLDAYATSGEGLNRIESAESMINTWLRPLLALAIIGSYAFFVFWVRRVTRNLSVFDRAVPEVALWMWVIPIVNVFVLYRQMDLAWKGSDALNHGADWRRGRPDAWNLGFAVLVIIGFGLVIYGFLLGSDTFAGAIDANAFSTIGYALLAASLLCAVKAVGNVIHRQRTRAESFA